MTEKPSEKPGVVSLAYKYTRALSRWIKAGRPVRGEEEIHRIFQTFCRLCEGYDAESSSCRHCGCRVNTKQIALLNKIAMGTETCPLEKWGGESHEA